MAPYTPQEDPDPPARQTIDQIKAALQRSRQDITAGRIVDGRMALDDLDAMVDLVRSPQDCAHGAADE